MRIHGIAGCLFVIVFLAATAYAQDQGSSSASSPAHSESPAPMRIRIGGNVAAAKMRHQVMPVYPPIAKTAHITGTVVMHAVIARDGSVQALEYVSGPPLLMKSAMDAVKQWVYEPTLLNGNPVEVDTTISVVFTLGGGNGPSDNISNATGEKPIDPQLKEDILILLKANHMNDNAAISARSIMESVRPVVIKSLPATPKRDEIADAYLEKLADLFKTDAFTDSIVKIYAKYFSDDDVKALVQFYQSPAGQRFNEVLPKLIPELQDVGRHLATDNMGAIWRELCKTYPELKGKAAVCPADSEKNSQLFVPQGLNQATLSAQQ